MDRDKIVKYLLSDEIILATVSGVLTTKPHLIRLVDETIPEINIITTKSFQAVPNPGNREPIVVETAVGNFGNAVGLRNPGMMEGLRDLRSLSLRALLCVSISASRPEDFIALARNFEGVADILELNFSCPHAAAGFGSSIGSSPDIVREYVTAIRQRTRRALIFPKLTPNVENIGEIAAAAVESGADGISAVNTVGPELYIEERSGKPVLNNPRGHVGGKSGEWIREVALEKVREIRRSVGDGIPIIGMGGVTYGRDVRNMIDAGANVVGIGSAFARVEPDQRPAYVTALKYDGENHTDTADAFVSRERTAQYQPFKIKKVKDYGEDLKVFELDGKLECQSSQFVFIWLADISAEKPFAVVESDPLTFIIRKRAYDQAANRGLFTHEMFKKGVGDELFVRGPYGAKAPGTQKPRACLVVGGTGIAVAPKLAEELKQSGKDVVVYFGVTSEEQITFKESIERYAKYIAVPDEGTVGRMLKVMAADLRKEAIDSFCFYNIGPVPMMKVAAYIQKKLGAKEIYLSLETNTMCGIGMCGECECGGLLTCKRGTFFSLDFLTDQGGISVCDEKVRF
jgi:dihydroorotate dehydrogenase electron transfer subunit